MSPLEITVIILCLAWIVAMPWLQRFKVYQFVMLLVMPFITCYLLYDSIARHGMSLRAQGWILLFFVGGWIWQAVRFYRKYLTGNSER